MSNFCTLFDSNYLIRGLAMYLSLKKYCPDCHLYIFAFDDLALNILKKLNLDGTTLISLSEFEDEKLLNVKLARTTAEYCWTCTSSSILYAIEKYNLPSCTYLDADILFFDSPEILLNELNDKSVLLTEHRYPPEHDKTNNSGKYCVQFITFKNDSDGMKALRWWREACLDWCYARPEDGKFGDQKYLDDWLTRFSGIHVLENLGGGVAPWNVLRYDFFIRNGLLYGRKINNHEEFKVIFFHFHHVKIYNIFGKIKAKYFIRVNKSSENIFYREYQNALRQAYEEIKKIYPEFNIGFENNNNYFIQTIKENLYFLLKNNSIKNE